MLNYKFSSLNLTIYEDDSFTSHSSDNIRSYDHDYIGQDKSVNQVGVLVSENDVVIKSAIIGSDGGKTSVSKDNIILSGDLLFIAAGDTIFKLKIPDLKLVYGIRVDEASIFGIHQMDQDIIVHGELQITRLTNEGSILWQKSGMDIFTQVDGTFFKIENNEIHVRDWEENLYIFDKNGNTKTFKWR